MEYLIRIVKSLSYLFLSNSKWKSKPNLLIGLDSIKTKEIPKRDSQRDFTSQVKREEKVAANFSCRICGKSSVAPNSIRVECAHIYSHSQSPNWKRRGSNMGRWSSDEYVRSIDNCVLICAEHHLQIDSNPGLQRCSVEYLESLKKDLTRCTALVNDRNGWRRCQNRNSRFKSNSSYRCSKHLQGGLENTLPKRSWTPK